MSDDRSSLPLDKSGNGERFRTLEFDEADGYMLAHAVMIAANCALMNRSKTALRRLNHYRDQFLAFAPEAAKLMQHDSDLCEIAIEMASASSWTMYRMREREWSSSFRIVVSIAEKCWKSDRLGDDADFDAIKAMVETIAPTSCVFETRADQIGNPWSV